MVTLSAAVEMLQAKLNPWASAWLSDDFHGTRRLFLIELPTPFSPRHIEDRNRSFISVMEDDGEGMEIARSIVPMANNLRLDRSCRGVETIQQVALLKKLQCKYGQGFYFFQTTVRRGYHGTVGRRPFRGKRASKPSSSAEFGTRRTGTDFAVAQNCGC